MSKLCCTMIRLIASASLAMALCETAWSAQATDVLSRFMGGARTLSADFTQLQQDDAGQEIARSSGHMWLQRPGLFRWSYQRPYEQLLICDGDKVWLYDPDLAQVTVRDATQMLAGTPAALLSQSASLEQAFDVETLPQEEGQSRLRLTPKSAEADFESIDLWLQDNHPTRMLFTDTLGGTTDVRFTSVEVNQAIDAERFRFQPPSGVEIVDATGAE